MRLKIRHEIVFAYPEPVRSALHALRVTPRNTESQFVRRWRIDVDGDARFDRGEDAHGNITQTVFVDGPLDRLSFAIEGEIDTTDSNGIVKGTAERLPLPVYLRETALTTADAEVRRFAQDTASGEAGDTLATLHRMMQRLHAAMTIKDGDASLTRTAALTFATQTGTVTDATHLLVAAARCLSISARLVTGYLFEGEEARHRPHAWCEAWLPRIGWIGFDVARGLCVTDHYVRVASGLDLLDAAPVRSAAVGGQSPAVAAKLSIEAGRQVVET